MAIKTRLTTKGFEEYLERLAQAGKDIDTIAGKALAAGGQVLAEGMVDRAPEKSGDLKASLGVTEPKQDGNFVYVEVGIVNPVNDDVARYGNVQEFGSARTPAHPYVRPALDGDMGKARQVMREVYEAEMQNL